MVKAVLIIALISIFENLSEKDKLRVVYPVSPLEATSQSARPIGSQGLIENVLQKSQPGIEIVSWPLNRGYHRYKDDDNLCIVGYDKPLIEGEIISAPIIISQYKAYRLKEGPEDVKIVGLETVMRSFTSEMRARTGYSYKFADVKSDLLGMLQRRQIDAIILGERGRKLGLVDSYNLVEVAVEPVVLNQRLHCHNTTASQNLISSLNNNLKDESGFNNSR